MQAPPDRSPTTMDAVSGYRVSACRRVVAARMQARRFNRRAFVGKVTARRILSPQPRDTSFPNQLLSHAPGATEPPGFDLSLFRFPYDTCAQCPQKQKIG